MRTKFKFAVIIKCRFLLFFLHILKNKVGPSAIWFPSLFARTSLGINADFIVPSQEAMMDHSLQMISYIADIGDIVVLMARRKLKGQDSDAAASSRTQKKCVMICHVFSSEDVSARFGCFVLVPCTFSSTFGL